MFLNEVALGKEKEILRDNSSLVAAPSGYDSVLAKGQTEPGMSLAAFTDICVRLLTAQRVGIIILEHLLCTYRLKTKCLGISSWHQNDLRFP